VLYEKIGNSRSSDSQSSEMVSKNQEAKTLPRGYEDMIRAIGFPEFEVFGNSNEVLYRVQ
jgi:hypothetical protein